MNIIPFLALGVGDHSHVTTTWNFIHFSYCLYSKYKQYLQYFFFLNLFIIENFKYMQKNSTVKHHMPSNKTVIHSWPPVSPRIFSHLCQYSIIIPVSLWLLPIMVSPDIHKAHFLSPFMFSLTSP
jgi:hypothetical protein